ncbi:hypothetical protein, partial [Vibrio atlanticus]|uniref:hypothetical protein n=1 Tax=Vibrio atlanticus TaxID=693153 RepID=UPI003553E2C9
HVRFLGGWHSATSVAYPTKASQVEFSAVALSNSKVPRYLVDLLLIHILFMGVCPTRSYPFF